MSLEEKKVSEINNLIDKISVICEQNFDDCSQCFFHLKKLREAVNNNQENIDDDSTAAFDKLNVVLNSIDLSEEQKSEIEQLLEYIKFELERLAHRVKSNTKQIIELKKDYNELKKDIIELKKDNNELKKDIIELKKDIIELKSSHTELVSEMNNLKERASSELLKYLYAHLLTPFVNQMKEALDNKDSVSSSTKFRSYSSNILKQIKMKIINDDKMKLLDDMITQYSVDSLIDKETLIDLLIYKTKRNYETHGIVEDLIEAMVDEEFSIDQVINQLEHDYATTLIIDNNEKEIILKLFNINVCQRRS